MILQSPVPLEGGGLLCSLAFVMMLLPGYRTLPSPNRCSNSNGCRNVRNGEKVLSGKKMSLGRETGDSCPSDCRPKRLRFAIRSHPPTANAERKDRHDRARDPIPDRK